MLTAILSGKAGRIQLEGVEHRISWREVFKRSEDLLTSVFFSRLRYLSEAGRVFILTQLIGKEAAENLGALCEIEFWPKFTGLQDRAWVEPDVLITFENAVLLIEVKPPFGGAQYLAQWQAEIHSFVVECESGNREVPEDVHFVAFGRNQVLIDAETESKFETKELFNLHLHSCEWEAVAAGIRQFDFDSSEADEAIFDDWQQAFELFGITQPVQTWTSLLAMASSAQLSLSTLKCWKAPRDEDVVLAREEFTVGWKALIDYANCNRLGEFLWK